MPGASPDLAWLGVQVGQGHLDNCHRNRAVGHVGIARGVMERHGMLARTNKSVHHSQEDDPEISHVAQAPVGHAAYVRSLEGGVAGLGLADDRPHGS